MPRSATTVSARAPARIDLAGGTLDIWPISVVVRDAQTVNLAIELFASATVEPRADGRVVVISRDRGVRATRRLPLAEPRVGTPLSLLFRVVHAFAPRRGLTLTCRAEAPAGAGLGGSSTLVVAVGAAMARFTGMRLSKEALLRRVMNLETRELRVPTGDQDYLAAIHGGLSVFRYGPDGTARDAIRVPRGLPGRLVLAYTGEPRGSGFSNWDMFRRFVQGERTTVGRMEEIAQIAREMAEHLRRGRLDDAGRLLGKEGRLRYRLSPAVATPALRRADRAARRAGALGVKVCGAGGGGCLVAFAPAGGREAVAEAIARTGARVLESAVATTGVRVSAR